MNELYVIQCNDDPNCAPWAYAICKTLEEAIHHAQYCDDFRCIEIFTMQNNIFKHTGKFFDKNGSQSDYHGNAINNQNFDSEINETLRIAGVQLNENSDDFYAACIAQDLKSDNNIYIQSDEEIDDGQDYNEEKIIQSINYIMKKYNLKEDWIAAKAYSELSQIDYFDIMYILDKI